MFKDPKNIDARINIKIPESEVFGKKLSGSLDKISISGTGVDLGEGNIKSDLGELARKREGRPRSIN